MKNLKLIDFLKGNISFNISIDVWIIKQTVS